MAIVTTRGQRLRCFQTANSKSAVITTFRSGTKINITTQKTVNGIVWGKVDDTGWVIIRNPMVSYAYVDLDDTKLGDYIVSEEQKLQFKTKGENTNKHTQQKTKSIVNFGERSYNDVAIEEPKIRVNDVVGAKYVDRQASLDNLAPQIVQNTYGFPYLEGFDSQKNMYRFDYYMDYSKDGLDSDMEKIRRSVNYDVYDRNILTKKYMSNYNRFKTPSPNDTFVKGFPHIFFTRPCCNILVHNGQSDYRLTDTCGTDNKYINLFKNDRDILIELTGSTEYNHDFSMYLSNKAQSLDIKDTQLESDTYGRNLLGYQIAYAKHGAKSKSAGDFSIKYTEDRNLHVLKIHDVWTDYIDKVYRGRFSPLSSYILSKVLDYACSVYYILTAEDGETILYWCKYYGVFPTNVPESSLEMSENNFVKTPEFSINYAYSFKEAYDPRTIVDFNLNSNTTGTGDFKYVKTYAKDRYGVGDTWVGAPFIEMCPLSNGGFVYKLRYRRSPDLTK